MATSTGLAMSWDEWHKHDALALAGRVRARELTAKELSAQAAEAVHHPFRIGGPPAWINTELGHPCGVEARRCLRLELRAAQSLAELGHLRNCKVARRTVTGKALVIVTELDAAEDWLAQKCGGRLDCTA